MTEPSSPSISAILAVAAFSVLSLVGGWIIIQGGGFFHSPDKYAANAVFYTGVPAMVMAMLQFTASALAFTWLLRLRFARWSSSITALTLVFGPPLLYLTLQP